jgi:hypothetical protein
MANTPSVLEFNPSWIKDPVPWWLVNQLDKSSLVQLAQVQLQHQLTVLESQMKAVQQAQQIIAKAGQTR